MRTQTNETQERTTSSFVILYLKLALSFPFIPYSVSLIFHSLLDTHPRTLEWWDAMLQKRLIWALFVVVIKPRGVSQQSWFWAFFWFINFPVLLLPPADAGKALEPELVTSMYSSLTAFTKSLFDQDLVSIDMEVGQKTTETGGLHSMGLVCHFPFAIYDTLPPSPPSKDIKL